MEGSLDDRVKQFAEDFKLNEGITNKLDAALKQRPDSTESNLQCLRAALDGAPSPVAVIFNKLRELELGSDLTMGEGAGPALAVAPDREVEELGAKYHLDQRSLTDLQTALAKRPDKKQDIAQIAKHLDCDRGGQTREVVSSLLKKMDAGEDIGEPDRHTRDAD